MTNSFKAGVEAAKRGTSIDNSYPNDHEEFVQGYKSVNNNARENLDLKALSMNMAPDEYPYDLVEGPLTKQDLYLFKQKGTIHSANVSDEDLNILNTLILHSHVSKVQSRTVIK